MAGPAAGAPATPPAGGSATISATSEGKAGAAEVTVLAPVASITVSPGSASAVVGNTVALTASPGSATITATSEGKSGSA